jgi:hypothetical protein
MNFLLLSQRIFQDGLCSASLAGPKANHDPGQINHITVAKSAGTFAPGQLQFDDSFYLLKPRLDRPWLVKPLMWNYGPANFIALSQPLDQPLVYPAIASHQPGPALIDKRRQMLFKQSARRATIHIA